MTSGKELQDDPSTGRRAFFGKALRRAVGPLAEFIEGKIDQPAALAPPPAYDTSRRIHLRPPGAIPEGAFLETCSRCGKCTEACPADAIFPLGPEGGVAKGTPVIDADRSACVVCEDIRCTQVCESGALAPVLAAADIRMGLAEVYGPICVRTSGEACTLCVEKCPIGDVAIRFPDTGPPEVIAEGCVGCGVCQMVCPTTPKAIVVQPFR